MKRKIFMLIACISMVVSPLMAQKQLDVVKKNGTVAVIDQSSIQKITFSGVKMLIATNKGDSLYDVEDIQKVERVGAPKSIDLGLSVKWASCNVGATKPEEYGDYYAWGETTTKTSYSESNSKWYYVSRSSLQSQGVIDSNGNLTAAYDAASQNWGFRWRMPTSSEINELRTKCTWTWTTLNGVSGYKVLGTNGNSIFLPAAGYRYGSYLYSVGSYGYFWSSYASDYDLYRAYFLDFYSGDYDWDYYYSRCRGYSVRPVTE